MQRTGARCRAPSACTARAGTARTGGGGSGRTAITAAAALNDSAEDNTQGSGAQEEKKDAREVVGRVKGRGLRSKVARRALQAFEGAKGDRGMGH